MTCVEIRDPRPDRARSRGPLFLASLLVLMSTAPELRSQQAVPPMPLSPGARVRVSVRLDSPAVVGGVCYNVIAGGALGGLLGGTVGTIAGALVGRERWQRVPLRSSP